MGTCGPISLCGWGGEGEGRGQSVGIADGWDGVRASYQIFYGALTVCSVSTTGSSSVICRLV